MHHPHYHGLSGSPSGSLDHGLGVPTGPWFLLTALLRRGRPTLLVIIKGRIFTTRPRSLSAQNIGVNPLLATQLIVQNPTGTFEPPSTQVPEAFEGIL